MFFWFKHLPQSSIDLSKWTPFIQNYGLRKHYMKFVYLFQVMIILIPVFFRGWLPHLQLFTLFLIGICIFIVHELLHIIVVHKKGDICFTFSGIYFWLHTNALLSKSRFWVFMSLPFIGLSIVPFIASFFVSVELKAILLFISWLNTYFSASDIINSMLIATKPNNSVFFKGYYRLKDQSSEEKTSFL